MPCAYLTDLATFIWNDLGSPSDLSVPSIQTKLTSEAFLGQLNSLTANCYSLVTGDISPVLGNREQGIYAMMYEKDFYTRKLNQLMAGDAIMWTRVQDGDSSIVRSDLVNVARLYRDMQKQLDEQLNMVIGSYRKGRAMPSSVDYFTLTNSRWYYGAYGGPIGGLGPGALISPWP